MNKKSNNLVIGIYFHPEAYPPTLNAIDQLSECFDRISIVHRPHLTPIWKYPFNAVMIPAGKRMDMEEQKAASFISKIIFFIQYVYIFYGQLKKEKPEYVLVYDSLSLYAYHLLRPLLYFKHKAWYHNHDVLERSTLKRFSIGALAAKAESKAFKYLDIFSLPSNDRKSFFPLNVFKGSYFFIPNFPSKKFYGQFYISHTLDKTVRIIYQGNVAPFKGIEQIIPLLAGSIETFQLELGLIGPCSVEYKMEIIYQAKQYGVEQKVHFNKLPYAELPALSATYHIGVALLSHNDIMTTTMGTASNKLYEYAAVGLPVVFHNSENFNRYLNKYKWAVPADVNTESIRKAIQIIVKDYDNLHIAAHSDFINDLNYEKGFFLVKNYFINIDKFMAGNYRNL